MKTFLGALLELTDSTWFLVDLSLVGLIFLGFGLYLVIKE